MENKKKATCYVTGTEHDLDDLISGDDIREAVVDEIRKDHPNFNDDSLISTWSCLSTDKGTWRP